MLLTNIDQAQQENFKNEVFEFLGRNGMTKENMQEIRTNLETQMKNPLTDIAKYSGGKAVNLGTIEVPFEEEKVERRELTPEEQYHLEHSKGIFSEIATEPDSLLRARSRENETPEGYSGSIFDLFGHSEMNP
jgi:hypothetical protein